MMVLCSAPGRSITTILALVLGRGSGTVTVGVSPGSQEPKALAKAALASARVRSPTTMAAALLGRYQDAWKARRSPTVSLASPCSVPVPV